MNSRSPSLGAEYTLSSTSRSSPHSDHRSSHPNRNLHRHLQFRYRAICIMKSTSFAICDFDEERCSTLSIGRAIREKKRLGSLYRTLQTPRLLSTTSIVPIRTLPVQQTLDNSSSYLLPSTILYPAILPDRCLTGRRGSSPENHLGLVTPEPSPTSFFIFDPNT